jgi:hypothetical protein
MKTLRPLLEEPLVFPGLTFLALCVAYFVAHALGII